MAVKKSELYRSLWEGADQLRGGMDASQYKDYVLVLLFIKYVSDKYAGQQYGDVDVPEGGSFSDMVALKGDTNIGDGINKIIAKLAEANDLKGTIDVADFNDADKLGSGAEMQDKLTKLIGIFQNPALDFKNNQAEDDDLLGDAYEYFMRHFATESGKSKGQFYTPAEVSMVMAQVVGIDKATGDDITVYDMTCGSGSLLLRAAAASPRENIALYGQEMDNATFALARMNMILHGQASAVLFKGNTLSSPRHLDSVTGGLKTFDFAIANPPFSLKAWTNGFKPDDDLYRRFEDGIPPEKNGDYAFLQHMLKSLKSHGKGAIILPHGVLFRGNAEAVIRRNIVQKGYIKAIIGLPPNLFYGTGIPACIIVLDKEGAARRQGIFMIDASQGFRKDGNKNRLRHQDIHRIVDVFNNPRTVPRYARDVPLHEIEANDYNLNIPRYIDTSEPEDLHDIEAHLRGGIPNRDIDAFAPYWTAFPALKHKLFTPACAGYSDLKVPPAQIKQTIFEHPEFQHFNQNMRGVFDTWKTANQPMMRHLNADTRPKRFIGSIGEALLDAFGTEALIDKYAVYQRLMDYWADTMQDDVTMLVVEGWQGAAKLRELPKPPKKKKGESSESQDDNKDNKEKADLIVGDSTYKAELIPVPLVIRRYFAHEQAALDDLTAQLDTLTAELEQLEEEHSGEDGLLSQARNEKDKLNAASVKARLKHVKNDPDSADETAVLRQVLDSFERKAALEKKCKAQQATLNERVLERYQTMSEDDIKTLVVDDKWLAALTHEIGGALERVSQTLAARVRLLAERYETPLPELERQAQTLAERVRAHLKKMGHSAS